MKIYALGRDVISKPTITPIILFCLLSAVSTWAQNLAPNPSFEEMNHCPVSQSILGPFGGVTPVKDWYTANGGSSDYFHACASASGTYHANGVPNNFPGSQEPRTGQAYVGGHIFLYQAPPLTYREYREYIQAKLTAPLIAGHEYFVRFWIARSTHYTHYIIDKFGAHFSNFPFFGTSGGVINNVVTQVSNPPGNFLGPTNGSWVEISGTFIASGGEEYIIIGNFEYAQNQQYLVGTGTTNSAYYYIDDVCVYDITNVTARHDTVICDQTINLTYSGREQFPYYVWSTGDSTRSITITEPGSYWVKSYDDCGWFIDTFVIQHAAIPPFSLGKDTAICDGSSTFIHVPIFPNIQWRWNDGRTDSVIHVTESGRFGVTLFNEHCTAKDEISIQIKDFKQDLGADTTICVNEAQEIQLEANVPIGAKVHWSTGSNEPAIWVRDSGTYTLTVSDFLCIGTDTIHIYKEKCSCNFHVPTAFTPNGDGLNDVFRPVFEAECPIDDYQLNVFNRWSERIFTSSSPSEGWNGTYRNAPAEVGTYFFDLRFEHGTHKIKVKQKGDLTLIR